jgi:hypothetical protein
MLSSTRFVQRRNVHWICGLTRSFLTGKFPQNGQTGGVKRTGDGNEAQKNAPGGSVPFRRSTQCYLLRLVADPRKSGKTRIRQSTSLLIDSLQSVGDFGQHREGETPGRNRSRVSPPGSSSTSVSCPLCWEMARGRTAHAESSSSRKTYSCSIFLRVSSAGRVEAGASRRTDGEPVGFERSPR